MLLQKRKFLKAPISLFLTKTNCIQIRSLSLSDIEIEKVFGLIILPITILSSFVAVFNARITSNERSITTALTTAMNANDKRFADLIEYHSTMKAENDKRCSENDKRFYDILRTQAELKSSSDARFSELHAESITTFAAVQSASDKRFVDIQFSSDKKFADIMNLHAVLKADSDKRFLEIDGRFLEMNTASEKRLQEAQVASEKRFSNGKVIETQYQLFASEPLSLRKVHRHHESKQFPS